MTADQFIYTRNWSFWSSVATLWRPVSRTLLLPYLFREAFIGDRAYLSLPSRIPHTSINRPTLRVQCHAALQRLTVYNDCYSRDASMVQETLHRQYVTVIDNKFCENFIKSKYVDAKGRRWSCFGILRLRKGCWKGRVWRRPPMMPLNSFECRPWGTVLGRTLCQLLNQMVARPS